MKPRQGRAPLMGASHWLDLQPKRGCGVDDRWGNREDGAPCDDNSVPSSQAVPPPPCAPLKKLHAVHLPHLESMND